MNYLRPAKFSTIHKVDLFMLEMELAARQIQCEVPDCADQAVSFLGDEMPAFICLKHHDVCKVGMGRTVKSVLTSYMKRVVLESANRAWAGTEDAVVFSYDPTAQMQRYLEAPLVMPTVTLTTAPPKVRPSIASLPVANIEMPLVEFFPLL